jgi:hypothetical protein
MSHIKGEQASEEFCNPENHVETFRCGYGLLAAIKHERSSTRWTSSVDEWWMVCFIMLIQRLLSHLLYFSRTIVSCFLICRVWFRSRLHRSLWGTRMVPCFLPPIFYFHYEGFIRPVVSRKSLCGWFYVRELWPTIKIQLPQCSERSWIPFGRITGSCYLCKFWYALAVMPLTCYAFYRTIVFTIARLTPSCLPSAHHSTMGDRFSLPMSLTVTRTIAQCLLLKSYLLILIGLLRNFRIHLLLVVCIV